ncbi:MAG: restriction endonuclease subunit R, partial [Anaerolineales bacterium]|nr:restriction endonuclease subunit R [Anaerolineales bacterium]
TGSPIIRSWPRPTGAAPPSSRGYLLQVLEGKVVLPAALDAWTGSSEKSWIHYIGGQLRLRQANPEGAETLIEQAAAPFLSYELGEYLESVRSQHEQIIDTVNLDTVQFAGWDKQALSQAESLVADFRTFCAVHQDELIALRIFYQQPFRRREVTFQMVKEVLERLRAERPALAPLRVWQAYQQLEKVDSRSPKEELIALVALIRRVTNLDEVLTPFDQTVDRNFKRWVFQKNAGAEHFSPAQMDWLRMIKEHIAASIHFDRDDLDYAPFDAHGGLAKMWQLFGEEMDTIIEEVNEALAA